MPADQYISPHFTWLEARCKDGTPVPPALRPNAVKLASQLEIVRAAWVSRIGLRYSAALIPSSWYRTPSHNQALRDSAKAVGREPGTAKNSEHMTAGAVDIHPVSLLLMPDFADMIRELLAGPDLPLIGGWGIYPQWIHLDIRPRGAQGRRAFWFGEGVASEMAA